MYGLLLQSVKYYHNNFTEMDESWKIILKGYTCLIWGVLCYIIAILAIQCVGDKTNIFELNCIRFAAQTGFVLVVSNLLDIPLTVAKKDVHKFAIGIAFDFFFCTTFYMASYVLPAGNLDGLYAALCIIITSIKDTFNRHITKISLVASGSASLGLILLTQPWQLKLHSGALNMLPCDYLDQRFALKVNFSLNQSVTNITWHSEERVQTVHSLVYGYLFILTAAISAAVAFNFFRLILQDYSIICLIFWCALAECILSTSITIGLSILAFGHLSLPSGIACLTITIVFLSSVTIAHFSVTYACKYLPASKVALASPFATVALYIAQRTVLKAFNPGYSNAVEIFGIICIFLGGILSPVITILYELKFVQYYEIKDG